MSTSPLPAGKPFHQEDLSLSSNEHGKAINSSNVQIDLHTAAALIAQYEAEKRRNGNGGTTNGSNGKAQASGGSDGQQLKEMSTKQSSGMQAAQFEFNDPAAVTNYCIQIGVTRANSSFYSRMWSGVLAGLFMVFATILDLSVAGGFAADFRNNYPAVPKILGGGAFGFGLAGVLMTNADLFTGVTMYLPMAWFTGRVTFKQVMQSFVLSFFSNLAGCLLFVYCFGYVTDLFISATYLSWVQAVAVKKVHEGFGVVLMNGIACNILVCLGVFFGNASRSALGRFILTWIPVSVFVIVGYDHVIANMAFIPLGIYYGAAVSTNEYIAFSMIPALIGNIIGGTVVVAGLFVYLYTWSDRHHKSMGPWLRYNFQPENSIGDEFADMRHQVFNKLPRKKAADSEHATAQPNTSSVVSNATTYRSSPSADGQRSPSISTEMV